MEIKHENINIKSLTNVASNQIRVGAQVTLPVPCKKVLTTSQKVFVTGVDRKESELVVSGKVVTRVVFIDETDGYNSEDTTTPFSEKFTVADAHDIMPMGQIISSSNPKFSKGENDFITAVSTEHTVNIALVGMLTKEVTVAKSITGGDIEQQTTNTAVATYGAGFFDHFESGESFVLDQNIEGILGVDANAHIRDISVVAGKFTVKGTACVTAMVVRNIEGTHSASTVAFEFDFSKTFNKKGVTERDTIVGSVSVSDIITRVENKNNAELVTELGLVFMGQSIARTELSVVSDAFSVSSELKLQSVAVSDTVVVPQTNIIADVEGNVTMPDNSPFIGKVLSWTTPTLGTINVKPTDDRVMVEGVMQVGIIYECEERGVYSYTTEVPFSINTKADGISKKHDIHVAVTPLSCNVKARRGKELLVDARFGVNMSATTTAVAKLVSSVELGKQKTAPEHSITIRVAGEKETVWNVAKTTSVPADEIVRQNPQIADGIQPGERIVIYKRA
ncbi:MAG: DUF3794 domain-containing protein [Firmicutes bacterium]|nr:DUF3794 domain-containing protein [Bacillota bacterium]